MQVVRLKIVASPIGGGTAGRHLPLPLAAPQTGRLKPEGTMNSEAKAEIEPPSGPKGGERSDASKATRRRPRLTLEPLPCRCGQSTPSVTKTSKARWVVACTRAKCLALVQAQQADVAVEAWNELCTHVH